MLSDPLHVLYFSREIGHIFIQTCANKHVHTVNTAKTEFVQF